MSDLSHLDKNGKARMVNVGEKNITQRSASASVIVKLNSEAYSALKEQRAAKGDVLAVAMIAGIAGAKRTSELIPLCHQLPLNHVDIQFDLNDTENEVEITSTVSCTARTGVEMEALTACSIAALTIYDMLKAVQKDIVIDNLVLLNKQGGRSGEYLRKNT